jgi:hypothetical protein
MLDTTRMTSLAVHSRQSLLVAVVMLAGAAVSAGAQSAFDVGSVPRPAGAEVATDRASSSSAITYVYPASVANTVIATEKSLNAGGWVRYRTPDEERASTSLRFKNGRLGIYVSFTMSGGKADSSRISYSHNNSIPANVPFPDDATDVVYDENRPYLRCVTALTVDAALDFFSKGLATEGWSQLSAAAIAARWPDAKLNDAIENGKRVYLNRDGRDRQPPVMLTLQRAAGDKTVVDIRIAPFALPQDLPFYQEFAGLPAPQRTKSVGGSGSADSVRRESTALVIAELPVVLAFYRREMALRGWQEQAAGASISDSAAKLTLTKPDDIAVLELGQRYDFTTVRLNAQLSQAAIAGRERAKKEADAKWMSDAVKQAQELTAASEAKRLAQVAAAAGAPVETLRPLANATTPIPLPENADEVKFEGDDGQLDFTSPSPPKSVATFYRDSLKPLGWKEERGVINGPTMFSMDFTKGKQKLDITVMLFGGKAKVSAHGSGLQVAAAPADPNRETVRLEADETQGFPVPKNYTMSAPGTVTMSGSKTAFRRDFNGKVAADIGSVLAFYRRELTKRAWKEQSDGAVVKPDNVTLAFASPDGPAWLKLGRDERETTINIVVKNPAEAAKADALPPAGMGRVVLGNLGEAAASVTINQKTIKVPPGVGKERPPKELMLDLKPGKYRYVLKIAGKRDQADELTLGADDTWALLIGPGGILPLQMY